MLGGDKDSEALKSDDELGEADETPAERRWAMFDRHSVTLLVHPWSPNLSKATMRQLVIIIQVTGKGPGRNHSREVTG